MSIQNLFQVGGNNVDSTSECPVGAYMHNSLRYLSMNESERESDEEMQKRAGKRDFLRFHARSRQALIVSGAKPGRLVL